MTSNYVKKSDRNNESRQLNGPICIPIFIIIYTSLIEQRFQLLQDIVKYLF